MIDTPGVYKMSNEESNKFLNEFQSATAGIEAPGIFIHNISEALPMFIPAFGVAWGSFTAWSTGAAFGALIAKNSQLSSLPPATLFLFSPFGALEVIAYSIAMSRSYILVWRIIKKNPLKKEIRNTAIEIGTVAVILLVAGFVESSIISQSVHHVSLSS